MQDMHLVGYVIGLQVQSNEGEVGKIIGQKLRIFTSFCPIINQILSKNQILNS